MEYPAVMFRDVGAGEGGVGQASHQESTEEVGGTLAERALGEVDDEDAALVHHAAQVDRAPGLGDDVADRGRGEEGPNLYRERSWGIGLNRAILEGSHKITFATLPVDAARAE